MISVKITPGRQWDVFRTSQGRVTRSLPSGGGRFYSGGNVSLPGGSGVAGIQQRQAALFSSQLWMELGNYAIKVIRDRLAKGIGSNDQPMPPLTASQQAFKRRLGLQPIRDLWGPGGIVVSNRGGKKRYLRSGTASIRGLRGGRGHMLDDLRVNGVSESGVSIDITITASRQKARANERRAAWIGFSPNDRRLILAKFRELFGKQGWDATSILLAMRTFSSARFGSFLRKAA